MHLLDKTTELMKMKYTVIEHYQLNIFIQLVNQAIAEGWVLHGGVSKAISAGNSETWSQAMVKEEK